MPTRSEGRLIRQRSACLDCAHRRTSIASGMAHFATYGPGVVASSSSLTISLHSRQPDQSAVPGNLLVGSLSGKSFERVGDANVRSTQANHPKGILIARKMRHVRSLAQQDMSTDRLDRLDGLDCGLQRDPLAGRRPAACLLAADDTTVPPHMSSTRSARARRPHRWPLHYCCTLSEDCSLVRSRACPSCMPFERRLIATRQTCMQVHPSARSCTAKHSFPVKELPHPSKDQDHQEC
jgi:hypothetical protein